MKTITAFILTLLLATSASAAVPEAIPKGELDSANPEHNYCLDAEANADWDNLVRKNQGDAAIEKLFALRIGICAMIAENRLALADGIKYFEQERERLLQERQREMMRRSGEWRL
jgi:hypothetical protein